jgi:hypothetical protein|tara:strand:- start:1246 stop:1758 length:513 start_codon:yes stop_codon:yes gene_type:complete
MASVSSLAQNLNYLQPTGYKVIIDRKYYPNLEFFCQTFQHPGMTATAAELPFKRIGSVPFQADKLTFGELILTIIVDEEVKSYTELYNWMEDLIEKNNIPSSVRTATEQSSLSDITVGILNSHNNVTKKFRYIDCVPTLLGDLNFESIGGAENFLTFPASFRFSYFEIIN